MHHSLYESMDQFFMYVSISLSVDLSLNASKKYKNVSFGIPYVFFTMIHTNQWQSTVNIDENFRKYGISR